VIGTDLVPEKGKNFKKNFVGGGLVGRKSLTGQEGCCTLQGIFVSGGVSMDYDRLADEMVAGIGAMIRSYMEVEKRKEEEKKPRVYVDWKAEKERRIELLEDRIRIITSRNLVSPLKEALSLIVELLEEK
jgi:hypothetical protein